MSAGNLGASIGNANTVKIPFIGLYVQNLTSPDAADSYMGCTGTTYYNRNVIDEIPSTTITVNGNSGAAAGKLARWGTNTASLTVSADQTCAVSGAGVITAATGGAFKCYFAVGTVIPANSFFWVFTV